MTDLIATTIHAALVQGALDLEETPGGGIVAHRLPPEARAQADARLAMAEAQGSGVRLAFHTSATVVELEVIATKLEYVGSPRRPDGVFDLFVDRAYVASGSVPVGRTLTTDLMTGAATLADGPSGILRFEDLGVGAKDVEIWLPWNEAVELVGLRSDAPLAPISGSGRRVWLHHGSSISHGSMSSSGASTWVATTAVRAGVDVVNLGFSGSAVLDPFIARAMRDTPADLISVKLGINIVNGDLMRLRAFVPAVEGFLDTIREGHPDTPLLVVSSVLCPTHESTPGPLVPDLAGLAEGRISFHAAGDPTEVAAGKLTLEVIRAELERIVARRSPHDPHLSYLDGRELYGVAEAEAYPLPDGVHPGEETQKDMGERFAAKVFAAPGFFAPLP